MASILGVPPSPYVRKVILAHEYKNIPYELNMVFPGSDDEEFRQASPLGKVPAYITDDGFRFADSSVIIAYLEKTNSQQPLYPTDANDYARALWLEEYADTKLTEVSGALYFQRVIGPKFMKQETDNDRCSELTDTLIPRVLDYLEAQLSDSYFVGDQLTVADIAIGGALVNLKHASFVLGEENWPKLSKFQQMFFALPMVQKCLVNELQMFDNA